MIGLEGRDTEGVIPKWQTEKARRLGLEEEPCSDVGIMHD